MKWIDQSTNGYTKCRVQGDVDGRTHVPPTEIPWWLAEIAYKAYVERHGSRQSLERINERGGFGRDELVNLIVASRIGRRR